MRTWASSTGKRMKMAKPTACIVDMDGTLCDVTSVRHHVLDTKRRNYDAFHYGSIFCPPHDWVVDEVRGHFYDGHRILIVTARKERWWDLTSNWLGYHKVPYDELHMRRDDDDRKDRL